MDPADFMPELIMRYDSVVSELGKREDFEELKKEWDTVFREYSMVYMRMDMIIGSLDVFKDLVSFIEERKPSNINTVISLIEERLNVRLNNVRKYAEYLIKNNLKPNERELESILWEDIGKNTDYYKIKYPIVGILYYYLGGSVGRVNIIAPDDALLALCLLIPHDPHYAYFMNMIVSLNEDWARIRARFFRIISRIDRFRRKARA